MVELRRVVGVMGTVVSFLARFPAATGEETAAHAALDEAEEWLGEVDDRFTTWRPGSEWLRYVDGALTLDQAHPDLRHVVTRCHALTAETGGAFSLTADPDRPPDPAAYVKGWSIQRAADLLTARGAAALCINGGGDVVVTGGCPPWRIGVQHPHKRDGLVATIELVHGAVATSGHYERGAHIHDPSSGRRATTLASVTVTGPDLGTADAYATAAFALGDRAEEWLAGIAHYRGYVVRADASTWSSW